MRGLLISSLCFLLWVLMGIANLEAGTQEEWNAGALVLVNSLAPDYPDFRNFLEPYFRQFGVPYEVWDVAANPPRSELAKYALLVIGHRGLDVPHRFLQAKRMDQLLEAVRQGSGLVSFDGLLVAWKGKSPQPLYPQIEKIFHPTYGASLQVQSIEIGGSPARNAAADWIASGGLFPRSVRLKQPITLPGFLSEGSHVVASCGDHPMLLASSIGTGRAVLFTTYDWVKPEYKGKLYGLDDLVWRSLVWAARKPFVMRGMPHWLAFRVDDVSGFGIGGNQHLGWVDAANRYGLKPWMGLFIDDLKKDPQALKTLARLTQEGQATAFVHARSWSSFFYLEEPLWNDDQGRNIAGRPWPDAVMRSNFAEAEGFLQQYGIRRSKVALPHFYQFATNNFDWLKLQGIEFVGTVLEPGQGYGSLVPPSQPYLAGESRRASNAKDPLLISDWLAVPGRPDLDRQFFNFVIEIRDVAGYEWAPSGVPVEEAIRRGVEQSRREWDSLLPAVLFTHESDHIRHLTAKDRDRILSGVMNGLQSYSPIPVTLDFLCQYMRALRTSQMTGALFDAERGEGRVEFAGSTDVETRFMVFEQQKGIPVAREMSAPAFQGSTMVQWKKQ